MGQLNAVNEHMRGREYQMLVPAWVHGATICCRWWVRDVMVCRFVFRDAKSSLFLIDLSELQIDAMF